MVSSPAKVEVDESHKGAETIPDHAVSPTISGRHAPMLLTILYQDVQALLDQQRGIKNDQAEAQWKNVVACSDLEEIADCALSF